MGRRVLQGVRGIWINLGVALMVLVLVEGLAQVAFALHDRGRITDEPIPEDRFEFDVNTDGNWLRDYLRELREALHYEWHSYVYWRAKPHAGKYVNIDEHGIRRTWSSSVSPSPHEIRIFMFGGSTMWGQGARDESTIPSLVSKRLATQLGGVSVVNFGESAYVSTQEVIALMLELRKGNVPDFAVFYDGVNDAWAAFQSGVAGVPQNELNRIAEFNTRDRLNLRGGLNKLALYRLSRDVLSAFGGLRSATPAKRSFLDPALASAVVDSYLGNVRIVDALAREYGFRAIFFWQPTIYTKKILSEREKSWSPSSRRRAARAVPLFAEEYRAFNEAFERKMKTSKFENVYDLSRLFENDARTIFLDRFHVSEAGNEKIADAIAQTLLRVASRAAR